MNQKIKITFSQELLDQYAGQEDILEQIAEEIRSTLKLNQTPSEIDSYDDLFDTYQTSTRLQ